MVGVGVFYSVSGVSRVKSDIRPLSQQLSHRIENGSSTSHNVITLVGWQMYKLPKSCSKRASPPAQLPHFHLARHLTAAERKLRKEVSGSRASGKTQCRRKSWAGSRSRRGLLKGGWVAAVGGREPR